MHSSNIKFMWIVRYENDKLDYSRMIGIFPQLNYTLDHLRYNIDTSEYSYWLKEK